MPICASCGEESPQGFRFCPRCGASLSEAAAPREERKVVSVVFCDLVGSTAAAERMDPEDVRARLSRYHARVRAELERRNARYGLATMCIGFGQAIAAVIERV